MNIPIIRNHIKRYFSREDVDEVFDILPEDEDFPYPDFTSKREKIFRCSLVTGITIAILFLSGYLLAKRDIQDTSKTASSLYFKGVHFSPKHLITYFFIDAGHMYHWSVNPWRDINISGHSGCFKYVYDPLYFELGLFDTHWLKSQIKKSEEAIFEEPLPLQKKSKTHK